VLEIQEIIRNSSIFVLLTLPMMQGDEKLKEAATQLVKQCTTYLKGGSKKLYQKELAQIIGTDESVFSRIMKDCKAVMRGEPPRYGLTIEKIEEQQLKIVQKQQALHAKLFNDNSLPFKISDMKYLYLLSGHDSQWYYEEELIHPKNPAEQLKFRYREAEYTLEVVEPAMISTLAILSVTTPTDKSPSGLNLYFSQANFKSGRQTVYGGIVASTNIVHRTPGFFLVLLSTEKLNKHEILDFSFQFYAQYASLIPLFQHFPIDLIYPVSDRIVYLIQEARFYHITQNDSQTRYWACNYICALNNNFGIFCSDTSVTERSVTERLDEAEYFLYFRSCGNNRLQILGIPNFFSPNANYPAKMHDVWLAVFDEIVNEDAFMDGTIAINGMLTGYNDKVKENLTSFASPCLLTKTQYDDIVLNNAAREYVAHHFYYST
jgi:hypothetical protein